MGEVLAVLNRKLACFLWKGMPCCEGAWSKPCTRAVPVEGESCPWSQAVVTNNYEPPAAHLCFLDRHMGFLDVRELLPLPQSHTPPS